MAAVPSVPERAVDARAGDARLWQAALVAGLVLCVAYTAVPEESAARNLVIYPLTELGAIIAILVGIRRYRPDAPQAWLLIAAGLFAYLVGDVIWGVYEVVDRDPWPSVADAFYLAGYPLVAAGLVVGIRHRTPTGDARALIDAGLVAVSAALLAWVYIIEPDRAGADLTPLETLVTVAYPLADVLVLAVAVRLVIGSSWEVPALRLLLLGLLSFLVGDTLYALDVLTTVQENLRYVDTMLLLGVVLIGLAGLHRTMPALTEHTGKLVGHHGTLRLLLLGGVCLVPPLVLIIQAARGEELYYTAVIVAMVALSALVTARFVDITSRAERAARREETLGRYAGDLLSAGGREELFALAEDAARALAGSSAAKVVEPGSATGGFVAPVLVQGERIAELVVDAPPSDLRVVRDSLTSVAGQLSLALERERLLATEREAARAVAEQNERLRELDRMKDQFVSVVSHELRTPLTSIVGYLELVLEGEAGDLNEEQEQFLRIVDRNCDRLNQLVDEILFIARVDAGRFTLAPESVDLGDLAEAAVKSAQAAAKRKGIEVRLSAEDGLPPLWADPTRLTQVLDNLLSNAVKFTQEGGIVRVSVARREALPHIEVADTGVGIPADEVGRLFERFFRASTAATVPGTGLGLSIVKQIVEAHGGTISVESEEGVGTTFFVDLPLSGPPEAHAAAGTSTEVAT